MDAARAAEAHCLPALGDAARHGGDAVARAARDALNGLGDRAAVGPVGARRLLLDVQVLGVFAHNDHVDERLVRERRGDALDGPHVGVEVEFLSQCDDGGRVACDGLGGGLHGAKERAVALGFEGVDGVLGQGGAGALEGVEAGFKIDKGEGEPERSGQGLEEASAGRDDFAADAVAGNEAWEEKRCVSVNWLPRLGLEAFPYRSAVLCKPCWDQLAPKREGRVERRGRLLWSPLEGEVQFEDARGEKLEEVKATYQKDSKTWGRRRCRIGAQGSIREVLLLWVSRACVEMI